MHKKAQVINIEDNTLLKDEKRSKQEVALRSGRNIRVYEDNKDEILEITEKTGKMTIKMRLTDSGPVISVEGASLELNAKEDLALQAKRVKIRAKENISFESKGTLNIDSKENMGINSSNDIKVLGKMIYLN